MDANLTAFMESTSWNVYNTAVNLHGAGNLLISPLSVLYATLLVYVGSAGNTRANLDNVFKFNKTFNDTSRLLESLAISKLIHEKQSTASPKRKLKGSKARNHQETQPVELSIVNGAFIQDGFKVEEDYKKNIVNFLQAQIVGKNFINQSEASRVDINKWVQDKTAGKIKELIPKGSIDFSTRLVLANALYFKAAWLEPFSAEMIVKEDFLGSNGKPTGKVQLMKILKSFNYVEDAKLKLQYLEIPYVDGEASLVVILPRDFEGLQRLESKLTAADLSRLRDNAIDAAPINIYLPKFKVESDFDVVKMLQRMGVNDLFTEEADLTGISANAELQVGAAYHKTFIDLNENGTEATAATGMVVQSRMGMVILQEPVTFKANHPFLYFIRHNPTNLILFMGRIESM